MKLIPEQMAVVEHDLGPALVFAVAGAGKTTAMVARAERLVREGVFNAREIFAGSFSNASVNAIERKLKDFELCSGIELGTTHRLARQIINVAVREHWSPELSLDSMKLFGAAAAAVKVSQANLAPEVLLEHVRLWKANLVFADLGRAVGELIPMGASQLHGGLLEVYRAFERIRLERGLMDFCDLIADAWLLLRNRPELLERVQNRYRCLFIDEYQDVNLAQAGLVDLIAARDRNIMVLGDDDQCIFSFQGASSSHILNFEGRWQAKKFVLSDNFRCQASHLGLANRVIANNSDREVKQASLTLGFGGETKLYQLGLQADMAEEITQVVAAEAHSGGLENVAILVRNFNNSTALESRLLKAGIPYRLEGREALRERAEGLALMAAFWLSGLLGVPRVQWTPEDGSHLKNRWSWLVAGFDHQLKKALKDVPMLILEQGKGLTQALNQVGHAGEVALEVLEFTLDLKHLSLEAAMRQTAQHAAWHWNEKRDPRKAALLEDFCASINARETLEMLLNPLVHNQALTLSSIHSSKGLEWDVVIMPDVDDGVLPHGAFPSESNLADERRLFYVGVTRCRQKLHLFTRLGKRSRFFDEALIEKLLSSMVVVGDALQVHPRSWTPQETLEVARSVDELGLERYFERFFKAQALLKEAGVLITSVLDDAKRYGMRGRLEVSAMAETYWRERSVQRLN